MKAVNLKAMEIILIRNFLKLSVLDCNIYAQKYLDTFGSQAVNDLVNYYTNNIDTDYDETLATISHDINLLHDSRPQFCVPRTLK